MEMKVITFVRQVAHSEGIKPAPTGLLEYIMWERTGFPIFWRTKEPLKEFEGQLREAFREIRQ